MKIEHFRDLTLIHLDENNLMVVACDSCGGIGMKEADIVQVSYEVLGYYTASVVLCELLALGATPILIVDNICMGMDTAGKGIIRGIIKATKEIDLDGHNMLTGSTEENMLVKQSGLGITCIGRINKSNWSLPKTYPGDGLVVVGSPKVGEEVIQIDGISNLQIINQINNCTGIHEILPVGSKGIRYEVDELCRCNNIVFGYMKNNTIDIDKSAGPATCFLVSGDMDYITPLLDNLGCDFHVLGKFS